jgi:hypothetical protein
MRSDTHALPCSPFSASISNLNVSRNTSTQPGRLPIPLLLSAAVRTTPFPPAQLPCRRTAAAKTSHLLPTRRCRDDHRLPGAAATTTLPLPTVPEVGSASPAFSPLRLVSRVLSLPERPRATWSRSRWSTPVWTGQIWRDGLIFVCWIGKSLVQKY